MFAYFQNKGICIIASECINVTTEECLSPVKCRCNEPFGGSDCSIDLQDIPDMTLEVGSCCDLRKEECNLINAYGFEYSTRDDIFVKVVLSEGNRVITDYYKTRALSDNSLLIRVNKLSQLALFNNINNIVHSLQSNESKANVDIYISYTNSSFKVYSSFLVYDSKCRECSGGLKIDTCDIEGVCYFDKDTLASDVQFVCNADVDQTQWTYIPTPDPLCSGGNLYFLFIYYLQDNMIWWLVDFI